MFITTVMKKKERYKLKYLSCLYSGVDKNLRLKTPLCTNNFFGLLTYICKLIKGVKVVGTSTVQ